jgi:hypothetical protein
MSTKRVAIGARPANDPKAESWVLRGGEGPAGKAAESPQIDPYTARLTIDVTPALRGRIKVAAFRKGLTVADVLRALLEQEFPDTGDHP